MRVHAILWRRPADPSELYAQPRPSLAPSQADFVFLSPPWGGPQYSSAPVYDLEDMGGMGLSLSRLLGLVFDQVGAAGVQAFLPRNADLRQAVAAAGGRPCVAERIALKGYVKGVTVYYGTAAERWLALSESEGVEDAGLDDDGEDTGSA